MTELSFLLDLLLNEKLSKSVKAKVAARVTEVEATYSRPMVAQPLPQAKVINGALQAPSTVAALERHAQMVNEVPAPPIVAATPVVAHALQNREQVIALGMSGKAEPGRTSPRKF